MSTSIFGVPVAEGKAVPQRDASGRVRLHAFQQSHIAYCYAVSLGDSVTLLTTLPPALVTQSKRSLGSWRNIAITLMEGQCERQS